MRLPGDLALVLLHIALLSAGQPLSAQSEVKGFRPRPAVQAQGPRAEEATADLAEPEDVPTHHLPAIMLPPRPPRRAQDPGGRDRPAPVRAFRSLALGANVSTLGAGLEAAVPVQSHLNLRVDAAYLNWNGSFNAGGMTIAPAIRFTSGRATLDWFPHRNAFHISAGALLLRSHLAGSTAVARGNQFTLDDTTYINSVDDPVSGAATMQFARRAAPLLLFGVGNPVPRTGQHLSMPFEIGAAYVQAPQLRMQLAGSACTADGCFNAATNPQVQANLKEELDTIRGDLRLLRVFPILSVGLALRF